MFKNEKENQLELAKNSLNLMDKEWLGGQTGAQIAIHVKLFADEVNAFIQLINPLESKSLELAAKTGVTTLERVEKAGITIGLARSEMENGAKKASADAGKEAAWKLAESLSPIVAIAHGLSDYTEAEEGIETSTAELQTQVDLLVKSARAWHDKEAEERSKAESIAKIKRQITDYCAKSPEIDIAPR